MKECCINFIVKAVANVKNGITVSMREGYTFEGWATSENGDVEYLSDELIFVDEGTVLYAVWLEE